MNQKIGIPTLVSVWKRRKENLIVFERVCVVVCVRERDNRCCV